MSIYQVFILTLAATAAAASTFAAVVAAASTFAAVVASVVDGRVKHGFHLLS